MKISELITDKYKLRIPPTVYYDLLADVVEAEDEQEPTDNDVVLTYDMYHDLIADRAGKLEQELILNKIRAEIERLQKMCNEDDLNLMAQHHAFGMALDVIDKYKADSEV